jgi:hypothetical protein
MVLRVWLLAALAVLALGGCHHATRQEATVSKAPPGQAQMVFLRPTKSAHTVAIFMIDSAEQPAQFLGLVSSDTKLVARVPPGDHLFMVIADQDAEFMEAHLQAGSTYYTLARGRYDGNSDWHFYLLPIHRESADSHNLRSPDFRKWDSACRKVEKTPEADQWFGEYHNSVEYLRGYFLNRWYGRSAESRAELTLHADDGVVSLYDPALSGQQIR